MASKICMKILDAETKKALGYVRVLADSTYSMVRKEIIQDGLVSGPFSFIIEDDNDGEACTLNPIQEERWQVENVKVVGVKRGSTTTIGGARNDGESRKRQCQDLQDNVEVEDLQEENQNDHNMENISGSPEVAHNMLKSKLISKTILQSWLSQCDKTRKKLKERNPPRDDRFELSTKDLNGTSLVQIWCHECESYYGSGVLGKQSAYSCFSNFMRTHVLESQAHQTRYLAHRGLKVPSTIGSKDVEENNGDDMVAILAAIEDMNTFNGMHEGSDFDLIEATLNDYKDKARVRVVCKYDQKWLHLCPRRSDLHTILTEHINSKFHVMAVAKTSASTSAFVSTKCRGRPKKLFDADPFQKSLASFLQPTISTPSTPTSSSTNTGH